MSYAEWKDRIDSFKKVDVRGIQGNFFQGLKKQAIDLPAGEGMEVIQSFEPIPLISHKCSRSRKNAPGNQRACKSLYSWS